MELRSFIVWVGLFNVILLIAVVIFVLIARVFILQGLKKRRAMLSWDRMTMPEAGFEVFSEAVVPKKVDVVVVGSGLGGLSTASCLASLGYRVLVLEKHPTSPGGCTHAFEFDGLPFDTGVHYVSKGPVKWDRILDPSVCKFSSVGAEYDRCVLARFDEDGEIGLEKYSWLAGKERLVRELKTSFPKESAAIDEYFRLLDDAMGSFRSYLIWKQLPWILQKILFFLPQKFAWHVSRSPWDVVKDLTDNETLARVLTYNVGDHAGIDPRDGVFGVHAAVQNAYFHGAKFPNGGSENIWKAACKRIYASGGAILVNANVNEILFSGKRAVGVAVKKDKVISVVFADMVFSDVGVQNTYKKLIPSPLISPSLKSQIDSFKPGPQHISLFATLDGSVEDLDLPGYNTWFNMVERDDEKHVHSKHVPCFISFPCAKDAEWNDRFPHRSNMTILTIGSYEDCLAWKSSGEYDAKKKEIEDKMLDTCFACFPQLRGKVRSATVGTPLTSEQFFNGYHGSSYGAKVTYERMFNQLARCQTPFKNLYLCGQDALVPGIASALASGVLACFIAHPMEMIFGYGKP
eukprot:TRINITY_DN1029_c3_g1_i1.p1 TRINITY_DN1029_c3_g1~~TRINITY_DN1029_c3_g1_i1.p1  ORF type:complete len:575 (-),score=149.76 TRINITY_DN1029_c3_g1_i1:349-2073(-)